MKMLSSNAAKLIAVGLVVVVVVVGVVVWRHRTHHPRGPKMVYTSEGYGGFVPYHPEGKPKPLTPLQQAVKAYNNGHYKDAEAAAMKVVNSTSRSSKRADRNQAVQARYVLAFSAARRKDMRLARDRFSVLRDEAAKLPDKGRQGAPPGAVNPTLEQEGAYQHAVCTAALGDKKGAEAEYLEFRCFGNLFPKRIKRRPQGRVVLLRR